MTHFACFDCNELLGGQRYFMKSSRPYCCKCFEKIHIEFCATCGKSIGVEQGQITYEDQHWHATDECFKCYTCDKSLRGGLMFIPKHGVIYCSNTCLKFKSSQNLSASNKLNLIQQQQRQQSPIHSPRLLSPLGPKTVNSSSVSNSPVNPRFNTKQPEYINAEPVPFDQQLLVPVGALHNQSRSRKPFSIPTEFSSEPQPPLTLSNHSPKISQSYHHKQPMMHYSEDNSFDDLDAVEVINLNQHKLVRSRHSLPDLQQQNQEINQSQATLNAQPKKIRSSLKNGGYFYYNEGGQMESMDQYGSQEALSEANQPTSILKRHDSNEKMYPISRPKSSNASFARHPRRTSPYATINDPEEFSSTQPRQKRVQFANVPPLIGASSIGDLRGCKEPYSNDRHLNSSRSHHHRNHIQEVNNYRHHDRHNRNHNNNHHHHHHHNHNHGHSSHRRSSSTSNFNSSTMSSKSHRHYNRHPNPQRFNRSNINRSLNGANFGDSDHYEDYNSACEFENDDDYTCSTCSSTSNTTTTSTSSSADSDSDMDDFGIDNYSKFYNRMNIDQRSTSSARGASLNKSNNNNMSTRVNPALKISYVDSLPLARTNPAPSNQFKIDPKQQKSSKKKSISKFKKENCVVS